MTVLKAKAKINLFFHITGKREDGFHLIESLSVFANDIYDNIEITPSTSNKVIIKGGEFARLLKDQNNLISTILETFSNKSFYQCKLTKNIPIGAGLGGGSSDAAVVAKFLNIQIQELTKIGTDLPICYHAAPIFCSGIGEIIEPIRNFPSLYLILVNPRKTLLTKDVFRHNKHLNTAKITNKPIDFFTDTDKLLEFLLDLRNDLTDTAIELIPEIEDILALLKNQNGAIISRMSGSGPTCFAIFDSQQSAKEAQTKIEQQYPNYWVKYTSIFGA